MRPRFSVVIPTRNSADSISRTIVGVLSQTFAAVEVVIVDDASTDDTLDVVRMLADSRVRVISNANVPDRPTDELSERPTDQHTTGLGIVRSTGFQRCSGHWATTLDPGDEVDPGWLARMGRLSDRSGASFVTCGGIQRFSDMSETPISPIPVPEMGPVKACLRSGSFIAPSEYFRALSPSRLDDMVTAGISIIDAVTQHDEQCISTPEPLVHWTDGVASDRVESDDERQLSRLMAALETLALTPIPDGQLLARYAAMGGEIASRLGYRADARRLFAIARDTLPRVPQYWVEWVGSLIPSRSNSVNG